MSRRIIKKYANRRLYDVEQSRYITLADLKELIVAGAPVEVVDAKSGANLTREVLLQIVAEQEQLGLPILSETMLRALIRFYGHPLQTMASSYLELALQHLRGQSDAIARQVRKAMTSPADLVGQVTGAGLDLWQDLQAAMLDALNPEHKQSDDERPRKK